MNTIQGSFAGGMDLISDDVKISDDAYRMLINGRPRYNNIKAIKKHEKILNAPLGYKNGGYAIGNIVLLFVYGSAYYQEYGKTSWIRLPGFNMLPEVDYYFAVVPTSSFNFVRKSAGNVHSPMYATTDFRVSGTPSGLVVQDGHSQPWIIMYDEVNQVFTCRELKKYADWKNVSTGLDDREYVPIGKHMAYRDGKLYIVSVDRKRIYHSVTGRPLDFVIAVDVEGNKLPTEEQGGADALSFNFDYDSITCFQTVDLAGSFVYGTDNTVRIITADYTNTLYGEPTYSETAKINAGIVNQKSFVELLGDYAFIDEEGVKSFNAVKQVKWEGNNSYFSLMLANLFAGRKQNRCICTSFDGYALFNVDTYFGNVICVYDMYLNKWVSVDITECILIKDFFEVITDSERILYAVTKKDDIYKMYSSSTEIETCTLETRAFAPELTSVEHKTQYFRPFFTGSIVQGTVTLLEYVDEQESPGTRESKILDLAIGGINYPVIPPVKPNNIQRADNPQFTNTNGLCGRKIAYTLIWNTDAGLDEFEVMTDEQKGNSSNKQKEQTYKEIYGTNS